MRESLTYNQLEGTQKLVCDICLQNKKAADDNTELVIAFWTEYCESEFGFIDENVIRKYKPESLTKYRRNLVEWGLIHPSKESQEHSVEMEKQNHQPASFWEMDNRTQADSKRLEQDKLKFL